MLNWKTYCEWLEGKKINLLTKTGKVSFMEISIEDYIIHSQEDFLRFLVVKKTESQTFDWFTANSKQRNLQEINLKRIFDLIEKERFKDLESIEEASGLGLNELESGRSFTRSQTRIFQTHRDTLVSRNLSKIDAKFDRFDEIGTKRGGKAGGSKVSGEDLDGLNFGCLTQNQSSLKLKSAQQINKKNKDNQQNYTKFASLTPMNKLSKAPSMFKSRIIHSQSTQSKGHSKSSSKSQSFIQKYNKNHKVPKILKQRSRNYTKTSKSKKSIKENIGLLDTRMLKTGSIRTSLHSNSGYPGRINLKSIQKIVKKYFKPQTSTNVFHLSQAFLMIFLILHLLSVYIKDPLQTLTNQDLLTQAINVDTFSWEIWAQTYSVLYSDICRAVERGWFPSNLNKNDYGTDVIENCHFVFRRAGTFFLTPDNTLDMAVRNLTFQYLYDYEAFVRMEVEMPIYEIDYKTGGITWRNQTMGRRSAIKLMNQVGRMEYAKRDYENRTGIVPGIANEMDRDPLESFFRRAGLGDLNRQYAMRSYDFYEYLKAVARQNESILFYTTAVVIVFSVVAYFVFLVYLANEVSWMRKFYRKLFIIEVRIGPKLVLMTL